MAGPDRFAALSDVGLPERIHLNASDVERMVGMLDGRWYSTWWRVNGSYYQSITVAGDDGTFDSLVSFFYRLERKSTWHVSNHSSVRDRVIISGDEIWRISHQWGSKRVTIFYDLHYEWEIHFNHYRSGDSFQYSVQMSGKLIFMMSVYSIEDTEYPSMLKKFRLDVSTTCDGGVHKKLTIILDVSNAKASSKHSFTRTAQNTTYMLPYLPVDTSSGEIVNVSMSYSQLLLVEKSNGQTETYRRSGHEVMEAYGTPSFNYNVFWRTVGEDNLVPDGSTIDGPVILVVEINNRNRETNITLSSPAELNMESGGVRYRFIGGWNGTVAAGESKKITLGEIIVNTTPTNLSVRIPMKLTFVARGMVKGHEEYRLERQVDIIGNVYIPQQGPALVLEYIEHADLEGCYNAWRDKPLYFEPVSVIKFGFGVIRNDGGVDAEDVSVWMVFGNSTHNWTVGMERSGFNVSAGSSSEEFSLYELDLGNEGEMGGVIVPGEYFIEFHANYTYWNGSGYVNESCLLYVERLMWGWREVGGFYRGDAVVALRDVDVSVDVHGWPPEIDVKVSYDGHVPVNVSVEVNGSVEKIHEYTVEHMPDRELVGIYLFLFNVMILLPYMMECVIEKGIVKKLGMLFVFIAFLVMMTVIWFWAIWIPDKRVNVVEGTWEIHERVENITSSWSFEMVRGNGSYAENGYRCEVMVEYAGYGSEVRELDGEIGARVESDRGIYSLFPGVWIPVILEVYMIEMPVAVVVGYLLSRIIARITCMKTIEDLPIYYVVIIGLMYIYTARISSIYIGKRTFSVSKDVVVGGIICLILSVSVIVVSSVLAMMSKGKERWSKESEARDEGEWYPEQLIP